MKKRTLLLVLVLIFTMMLTACGTSICAKCGKEFKGDEYQKVIIGDGTGVLCEDCAGYEYGVDMERYKK